MATGGGFTDESVGAELSRLAALLQGGRPPSHPNRLSARQMASLAALCDTLLPAVDISGTTRDEALIRFYATSASMIGVPEHMGGMLSGGVPHPALGLMRLALWLLSTWYGTLAMCGRASLSKSFPYVRNFCRVEQRKRERILRALSLSSFYLYPMLFRCIKFLTLRLYFSRVDENNDNPSWKSIGYCGADPTLRPRLQALQQHGEDDDDEEEAAAHNTRLHGGSPRRRHLLGPLHGAVLDMSGPKDLLPNLLRTLHARGFTSLNNAAPSTTPLPLTLRCDAVVVGSGSGGGVVAGVLAKAGYRVIVLDKGRYFPAASLSLLEGPTTDQMYESGGLIATDDVGTLILAGATVGGGSAVNWSACIRTPEHVLNEWCDKHELKLFGGKAFREALDAVCARMGVRPSAVAGTSDEGLNNAVLRRGCSQLGYPVLDVPVNAPPGHGCGWCHLGCKDGTKKGTTETWLTDMADSGNGVILSGCRALEVLTKEEGTGSGSGRRKEVSTGVVAECEHGVVVVESMVTVVACGALNTPPLLRRSGLSNPNIGRHLHLHPTVMAWGYFPEESSSSWLEPEKRSYTGGILTSMSPIHADSGYGALMETPALHPGMFSVVTPWTSAADFRARMVRFSRTATLFTLVRDRGSGCSAKYPLSLTYKMDAADEENLRRGMERMLRVLVAAGAEEVGTHHRGGEVFRVRGAAAEEFEAYVRRATGRGLRDLSTPISTAHHMGSCRMGVDPETSAVSPAGETWEVGRLFVADTSVFPTAVGVNPMVTAQAIAYCTAHSALDALCKKSD